ncbi:MAG TPA: AAA family ATPase [Candidatus Nanopelagicales bacterium]|nr:AAA family ATPase [Candidatus Nanopelagicales bacterium]
MATSVVGREHEVSALLDWWAGTEDLGSALLVVGEPGVGRTTLVRELVRLVDEPHASVTPVDGEGVVPYAAVDRLLRRSGRPGLAPELLSAPGVDLVDAVLDQLATETGAARLLVVDDAHLLEPASARLIRSVAAELGETQVGLLLTAASGAPATTSFATHLRLLEVAALARNDIDTLAGGRLPEPALQQVYDASRGNPLLALELLRAWPDGPPPAGALPPAGFAALVRRRADALSPGARRVVDTVAVAGEADVDLVSQVVRGSSSDAADADAALDEALRSGLVRADGVAVLRPAHAFVGESLAAALPMSTAAQLHKRVAQVLAARPGAPSSAVAAHLVAAAPAGAAAEAVDACVEAAGAATAVRAYADAVRWTGEAVRLAPLLGADAPLAGLRIAHGDALARVGEASAARSEYVAAAEHAGRRGDWTTYAEAALKVGSRDGFEVAADDAEQLALLSLALEHTEPGGPLHARLLARRSVASWAGSPASQRERHARDAVAMARSAQDPLSEFDALAALHDAIAGPFGIAERADVLDRMLALSLASRDAPRELLARRMRVVLHLESGRLDDASDEVASYDDRARGLRLALYSCYPPLWRACLRWADDDRAGAEVLIRAASSLGEQAASANAAIIAGGSMFFGLLDSGEPWDPTEELRALLGETGAEVLWVVVSRAYARAALGDAEGARALLEQIRPALRDLPVDSEYLATLTQVAFALVWSGTEDPKTVRWVYESLLPHRDQFVVESLGAYTHGSVERVLGALARQDGRFSDARDHLARAREVHVRVGAARLVRLVDEADSATTAPGPGVATAVGIRPAALRPAEGRWQVGFLGSTGLVRDSKGMRDLAVLLASPRRPVSAWALVTGGVAGEEPWSGDLGETLDATARAAYRRRLAELDDELSRADLLGDEVAGARAYDERARIVAELRRATGRHGRARRSGDGAERARSTVTARIRDAIRRIAAVDPALGEHLDRSVRTGRECVYDPEIPVIWQLG